VNAADTKSLYEKLANLRENSNSKFENFYMMSLKYIRLKAKIFKLQYVKAIIKQQAQIGFVSLKKLFCPALC
jgi:hypothetical protein